MTEYVKKPVPLRYYTNAANERTPPEWLTMMSDGSLVLDNEVAEEFRISCIRNGKPFLFVGQKGVSTSFDLARLILSTLVGAPLAGQWQVGYRDKNNGNLSIENLAWRGDGPVPKDDPAQRAFLRGYGVGSDAIQQASLEGDADEYLAGVNYALRMHLQSQK